VTRINGVRWSRGSQPNADSFAKAIVRPGAHVNRTRVLNDEEARPFSAACLPQLTVQGAKISRKVLSFCQR
jgi:hypothetical protein